METIIATERMILRRFSVDDAGDFLDLNSDPEVVRYAEKTVMKSLDEARRALLDAPLKDYDRYGYGRLAVILKADEELVGFCGMKFLPELGLNELGYRLKKKCWGRGLATEAAAATLGYARSTLGLDYVIALIVEGNSASVRVVEKLGMSHNGMEKYMGLDVMKYELNLSRVEILANSRGTSIPTFCPIVWRDEDAGQCQKSLFLSVADCQRGFACRTVDSLPGRMFANSRQR